MQLKDLDSKENIEEFVSSFYDKVLADKQLAPIFHDVAGIDIKQHLPRICSYWEKLLLGDKAYKRHTMNIHREINAKQRFTNDDFERWLQHFTQTANEEYQGEKTSRAVVIATTIAKNMQLALEKNKQA
ncbi:MAG: group III truncated hemoglobin [Sinobacterium sp.]|nr:group III truncated hemoglobin [Sinobacterium sp.]